MTSAEKGLVKLNLKIFHDNLFASNVTDLTDSCFRSSILGEFQEDKWSSTVLTSQKKVYFGKGGLKLKTHLRNLETKGCLPTFDPSIGA